MKISRGHLWRKAISNLKAWFVFLQNYLRKHKYICIILGIAITYRALFQLPYDIPLGWDTPHYIYTTRIYMKNFSQGNFPIFPLDPYQGNLGVGHSTKFPLFFIFSAFFSLITGVDPYNVMLVFPIILYGLATVSIYIFGSTILDRRVGLFSALFWSLSFEALRISWDLHMNMLGMTLLMFFSSAFILWLKNGKRSSLILSIILFCMAVLSHDFSYFLGFSLILLVSIEMIFRDKAKARNCFIFSSVLSILFVPFHVWYYQNRVLIDIEHLGTSLGGYGGLLTGYPLAPAIAAFMVLCLLMKKSSIRLQFLATADLIALSQILLIPTAIAGRGLFNFIFFLSPTLMVLINHLSEQMLFNKGRKELKVKVLGMKISRRKATSLFLLGFCMLYTISSSYNMVNATLRPLFFEDYIIGMPGPVIHPHERDAILYFESVTDSQHVLVTESRLINWVIALTSRPTWGIEFGGNASMLDPTIPSESALAKGYKPYVFDSAWTQRYSIGYPTYSYPNEMFLNDPRFRLFYNTTNIRIWEYIG